MSSDRKISTAQCAESAGITRDQAKYWFKLLRITGRRFGKITLYSEVEKLALVKMAQLVHEGFMVGVAATMVTNLESHRESSGLKSVASDDIPVSKNKAGRPRKNGSLEKKREPVKICYNAILQFSIDGDIEKIKKLAEEFFIGHCAVCGRSFNRGRNIGRTKCPKCVGVTNPISKYLSTKERRLEVRLDKIIKQVEELKKQREMLMGRRKNA